MKKIKVIDIKTGEEVTHIGGVTIFGINRPCSRFILDSKSYGLFAEWIDHTKYEIRIEE